MRQDLIPIYNENNPSEFVNYPCSTQYMVYNGAVHKYFLTEEALNYYGIDVERKYISSSNNKTREFIEKVTKKVYDYIRYKSGFHNFQVQMYRIAKSTNQTCDEYAFRKEFEGILVAEAQYLIDNGDAMKYSFADLEKGQISGTKPEEDWKANIDVSPEVKRGLDFLGLTRWFTLARNVRLDTDKY